MGRDPLPQVCDLQPGKGLRGHYVLPWLPPHGPPRRSPSRDSCSSTEPRGEVGLNTQRLWKHGQHSRAGLNIHTPHSRGSMRPWEGEQGRVSCVLSRAVCEESRKGVPFQEEAE